jgi:hypothetical protein
MRLIAHTLLILAVAVVMGAVSLSAEAFASDSKAMELKRKAEAQIERVKAARERADARITLSKIRSSVQSRRAQEDLIRQVEMLDRIREVMQDQMMESVQSGNPPSSEAMSQLSIAMAQLDAQIAQTRVLINQLDGEIQAEEAANSAAGSCNNSGTTPWGTPCGSAGSMSAPAPVTSSTATQDVTAYAPVPSTELPVVPPPLPTPR